MNINIIDIARDLLDKMRLIVETNCISKNRDTATLYYWSEVVFAKCVFVLAPLSLLAIIPALIICLKNGQYLILWFDMLCFIILVFIGYIPRVSVRIRKILLLLLMFLASFVLLTEVGFFGPGLVYLLATTVFVLLLFPDKKTKIPFFLTLAFCIFYGLLIQFNLIEVYSKQDIRVIEWIAISSNVLFMSAVLNLMIPLFLSKLESTLEEKLHLLESVRKTNIELNKYIAEVSAKNSELEQFAFIASHDLQEPLRMISSFMDKLKTKYEGQLDEKAQQYIFFASDGAKRMKQIILDLLIYSRASRHAEGKETVDLNELLYEFKGLRRIRISEKKATIISTKLPVLNTYKAAITQVLHGLLDNALKYAKPNTPPIVEIDVIENENEWEFAIKDNGIGIDSEFYEKIFVIFQRLHNRNEYEGTGIGLSVAKRHVEFLGGRIWLESSLEVGTTFYFSLPKNN